MSIGLFWEEVESKAPERTWERSDYLPGLEQARQFNVELFEDSELADAAIKQDELVFDIECFPNYFLAAFRSLRHKKALIFELYDGCSLDIPKLRWVCNNFCLIGFNSKHYDIPMLTLALAGKSCAELKAATNQIINEDTSSWKVLKSADVEELNVNHIDMLEIAPLQASLKMLAGRMNAKRMWDLPFNPDTELPKDQRDIVRWYCINDLNQTELLYNELLPQINLRRKMSVQYETDLRSMSDAQIAESVIKHELQKTTPFLCKPNVTVGTVYKLSGAVVYTVQNQVHARRVGCHQGHRF